MRRMGSRLVAVVLAAVSLVGLSACGQRVDMEALPREMSWKVYQGQPYPVSPKDGPLHAASSVPWGFSPTPQGAVLAAVGGHVRLALASDKEWPEVTRVVTAPGRGREEFIAFRSLQSVTGPLPAGKARQFLGFKVRNWVWDKKNKHPKSCAVVVAQRQGSTLLSYPVAMVWLNGDWRILLPTTKDSIDATRLKNLDGFVALPQPSEKVKG